MTGVRCDEGGGAGGRVRGGERVGERGGGRSHLEVLPLALQDGPLEEEDLLGGQAAVTVGRRRRGSALDCFSLPPASLMCDKQVLLLLLEFGFLSAGVL